MRVLVALILAFAGLLALPVAVSADHSYKHTKCAAMVNELNEHRSPNVRLLWALCVIGYERSVQMVERGEAYHDLDYAIRRLKQMGYSYAWGGDFCGIGEAIGWTTAETGQGRRFVNLWLQSPGHDFIASRFYQRAGGNYKEVSAITYGAFYVVRTTC
jgi:uncharacterized protein YkwD